ncbi:hypothetical protein [Gemmata sp.]|uniref:hypothetical protein n=1 Tax=Gemmata sp. TaxID=1914242 RepID=UPI003F6F49DD
MNWTVIWLDTADAELMRWYVDARTTGHAEAYTRATAQIERLLESDPAAAGESRSNHSRVIVELPLTVEFEVHADHRTAVVTRVRYTPGRGPA